MTMEEVEEEVRQMKWDLRMLRACDGMAEVQRQLKLIARELNEVADGLPH